MMRPARAIRFPTPALNRKLVKIIISNYILSAIFYLKRKTFYKKNFSFYNKNIYANSHLVLILQRSIKYLLLNFESELNNRK